MNIDSEQIATTVSWIDAACANLINSTSLSHNIGLFVLTFMRNSISTEEKRQFWWLDSPELTPNNYDGGGPYTLVIRARKGDHIAVRTISKSNGGVTWHHGVYIDTDHVIKANSTVTLEAFVMGLYTDDNYVDSAGVVQYEGDSDFHRSITAGAATYLGPIAKYGASKSLASYYRTGRYLKSELFVLLDNVPRNKQSTRK